ncbi:hypothetical protein PQX77_011642 [Marasmius sp. AFHP31]|nr:hypothetical protein PQX77_011642 [Marasmius sp. AFHP31]
MLLSRLSLLCVLALHNPVAASNNFTLCLYNIQHTGSREGVDNLGLPVKDPDDATAIPYHICVNECGAGPDMRPWSLVAQEFSAWLLPYLALLSQLPFGAHDRWDNLLATILTIGSPALAAYSVAITVLNSRWIVRLFSSYSYPNCKNAVRALSGLQQSPIRINRDQHLLASLVVLPENGKWWSELIDSLDYAHTWSISAASFIAWVVVAYAFTIANSITDNVAWRTWFSGHSVGAIWLWLVPIVFSWLQISPKCDSVMVRKALDRANKIAYVAGTEDRDPILASRLSTHRAIYLDRDRSRSSYPDQYNSVPIYNYARLFTWTEAVWEVATCFSNATNRADSFEPVDSEMKWVEGNQLDPSRILPENRRGTAVQVERYCFQSESLPSPLSHDSGAWTRLFIASLAGLGLQWGTTGAAFLTVYFTPTTGFGCRSGAYLIYAFVGTLVMVMLILSSILAHYAPVCSPYDPLRPHLQSLKGRLLTWSSILLRRSGKTLGFCNAMWLITVCLFQITGFFGSCYCDGSVLGRGADKAFVVIELLDPDVKYMVTGWIGGMVLGVGTSILFIVFMNLIIQKCTND